MSKNLQKAVKEFTIDKNKMCTETLYRKDKSCATGRWIQACGLKEKAKNYGSAPTEVRTILSELYNKDVCNLLNEVENVNDTTKSSWKRRLTKIQKLFKDFGVKVHLKNI